MSNLQKYLGIVAECQKKEAALLGQSMRFCLDVTTKIAAHKKDKRKHLKEINVLDYYGLEENLTSDLIKQIFEYEHNGEYPVWSSFVSRFFSPDLAKTIRKPIFTAEQQRIDVSVKEQGKYAFVFENKLKGAVFQRNQLGRYVKTRLTEKYERENIYVVILPGSIDKNFIGDIRESAWRAPHDWTKPNYDRKCRVSKTSDPHVCWCDSKEKHDIDQNWCEDSVETPKIDEDWCKGCTDCKSLFDGLDGHIKVLDSEFPEWLIETAQDDSCVPSYEILVRSAMIQFAHYIKGLYNIRLNKEEIMVNIKVLEAELDLKPENPEESYTKVKKAFDDINELQQSLKNLEAIWKIKKLQKEIEDIIPDARVVCEEDNVHVLIKGISCGIWIEFDYNNSPFWGFHRNPNTILQKDLKDPIEIVDQIVRTAEVETKGSSANFLAWHYTEHGAEDIDAFLNAAEFLGYPYQRK